MMVRFLCCGALQEKGINVREALLEFHDKYFGANVSTLAVCGKYVEVLSSAPLRCVKSYCF